MSSNLSFQERLKLARRQAFNTIASADPEKLRKAEAKKAASALAKKQKAEALGRTETERRAKEVLTQRKSKRLMDGEPEPEMSYKAPSRKPPRDKPLPNRPLNLHEKIQVQVDKKTWVYVDPGADIEAVKAKYRRKPLIKDNDDYSPPTYDF